MKDDLSMETVVFQSGSRSLDGRLFTPNGPNVPGRGIIFVHGQGSSQSGYKRRAEATSISLAATSLTFTLSYHGNDTQLSVEYPVYDH
jgi:hypothetical protein